MTKLPKEFGSDNEMPVQSQKFGMLFEGCEKKCPTLAAALKKIEELEKWYKALLVDYKRVKQERSDLIQHDLRQYIPEGEYCGTCPFRKLYIRCRFHPNYDLAWAEIGEPPYTEVLKHPDCPGRRKVEA